MARFQVIISGSYEVPDPGSDRLMEFYGEDNLVAAAAVDEEHFNGNIVDAVYALDNETITVNVLPMEES